MAHIQAQSILWFSYADRFMILQYIFLGFAIGLFLMESTRDGDQKMQQLHRVTRWVIPLLWVISMVVLHVTTLER